MNYGDHRIAGRDGTVNELFERERRHLLSLPEVSFSNVDTASAKVDKYSTVTVDKNRYSVPTRFGRMQVRVILHVNQVEIFYGSRKIATHPRLYGNNKWQLNPLHYLELLSHRPHAFDSARPIRDWRASWPVTFERLLARFREAQGPSRGTREFIEVLMLFETHEHGEVVEAVEAAVAAGVSSGQAVEHLLLKHKAEMMDTYSPGPLGTWPTLPSADVSVYGQIGAVQ
jgi:hypothetical protein